MIRNALFADLPEITALYHAVWHETHAGFMPRVERLRRSPDFFAARMTRLLSTTIVHDQGNAIGGFAAWQKNVLGQVFVAPLLRGTGVADGLMAAAERAMRKAGIREAELHCMVGNDRARRFYERRGWIAADQVQELVLSDEGEIGVAFWRMTKPL